MKHTRMLIPVLAISVSIGLVVAFITHLATAVIIEQHTYHLTAVLGLPDQKETMARIVSAESLPQNGILYSSGHIPTSHATGMLAFLNNTNHSIILASSIFVGRSGIPISFNGPITIPAAPPDVMIAGFAMWPGSVDIPVFDLDQMFSSGIVVKNTTPFSLHPRASEGDSIQQRDIDSITAPWSIWLQKSLLMQIKEQLKEVERVVDNTLHCQQNVVTSPHPVHSATFAVQDICSEIVYNSHTVQVQAEALLRSQVARDRASPILGAITTHILRVSLTPDKKQVDLIVLVRGNLYYHVSSSWRR